MIPDLQLVSIFIRPGVTDMRKQANGLSLVVEELMLEDPGSGSLYLFCSKDRRLIKCLYWDRNGFCLWQKRIERDKFPWPKTSEDARIISGDQLMQLLSGIDFWNAHQSIEYQHIN